MDPKDVRKRLQEYKNAAAAEDAKQEERAGQVDRYHRALEAKRDSARGVFERAFTSYKTSINALHIDPREECFELETALCEHLISLWFIHPQAKDTDSVIRDYVVSVVYRDDDPHRLRIYRGEGPGRRRKAPRTALAKDLKFVGEVSLSVTDEEADALVAEAVALLLPDLLTVRRH